MRTKTQFQSATLKNLMSFPLRLSTLSTVLLFLHSPFEGRAATSLPTGSLITLRGGHPDAVTKVAWTSDGKLISGDWSSNVVVWDVQKKKDIKSFRPSLNFIRSLTTLQQGKKCFTCTNDDLSISTLKSGEKSKIVESQGLGVFLNADMSPDGKTLAVVINNVGVRFFSALDGSDLGLAQIPRGSVQRCLCYGPDGRLIVGGGPGTDLCWVFDPGQSTPSLTIQCRSMEDVAISPDGSMFAGTYEDVNGAAVIGAIRKTSNVRNLKSNGGRLCAVAWSPDGTRVATSGSSGVVELWEPASGHLKETLQLQPGQTSCLAFSPDGRWLAIGSGHYLDMTKSPPRQMTLDNSIRLFPVKFNASKASVLSMSTAGASQDVEARLALLKQQFEAAKKRVLGNDHERRLQELKQQHAMSIDKQIVSLAKAQQLEEAVKFKQEKEAVLANEPLPNLPLDASPALKSLRTDYEEKLARLDASVETIIQPLYSTYESALTNYLNELTKAQRLEDAVLVKGIRDGISQIRRGDAKN